MTHLTSPPSIITMMNKRPFHSIPLRSKCKKKKRREYLNNAPADPSVVSIVIIIIIIIDRNENGYQAANHQTNHQNPETQNATQITGELRSCGYV